MLGCEVINANTSIIKSAYTNNCNPYCCSSPQSDVSLCGKSGNDSSLTVVIAVLSISLGIFVIIACICKLRQQCCEDCQFNCFKRGGIVSNDNNLQLCNTSTYFGT